MAFGEIYDGTLGDDVAAALDRALAASVGADLADLEARISGEFGGFEVRAFFGKSMPKGTTYGWANFRGVETPALLAILAWMRARDVPLRVRLDLSNSPLRRDARVELIQQLLPGSQLVCVRRFCYPPVTERGEEPRGRFGVSLLVRQSNGDDVRVVFRGGIYGESEAAQVRADVEQYAAELAEITHLTVAIGE